MGARFSQSELRKAVDVAKEKGLVVQRFTIRPDGSIEVVVNTPAPEAGGLLDGLDLSR